MSESATVLISTDSSSCESKTRPNLLFLPVTNGRPVAFQSAFAVGPNRSAPAALAHRGAAISLSRKNRRPTSFPTHEEISSQQSKIRTMPVTPNPGVKNRRLPPAQRPGDRSGPNRPPNGFPRPTAGTRRRADHVFILVAPAEHRLSSPAAHKPPTASPRRTRRPSWATNSSARVDHSRWAHLFDDPRVLRSAATCLKRGGHLRCPTSSPTR